MSTYETLSPYEQWMVRGNLETVRSTGVTPAEQAALLRANGYPRIAEAVEEMAGNIEQRLEYLRTALRAENISYGELAELQELAAYIAPGDVELLEAAGVPEHDGTSE